MKFKKGDYVIGNALASRYTYTREGTRWYVLEATGLEIKVSENMYGGEHCFAVDPECFDIAFDRPAEHVFPDSTSIPDVTSLWM